MRSPLTDPTVFGLEFTPLPGSSTHAVRRGRGAVLPPLDEHLLQALPSLPDCAGVAVGVDRLLMAMNRTGRIADVLAFDFAQA